MYNMQRLYKAERPVLTTHALLPESCYAKNCALVAAEKPITGGGDEESWWQDGTKPQLC